MSFKSLFGDLEDAGGSLLGFGILILILKGSQVFDIPLFLVLPLYNDFEVDKTILILSVLILGFGGN